MRSAALVPAIRFLRGCALAGACSVAATVCAVVTFALVRTLAVVAEYQPELFVLAVFAPCLWLFVRFAFRQREWN